MKIRKYIVTAKNPTDIITLSINTKSVDVTKVEWDWQHIYSSEEYANCNNEKDILNAIDNQNLHSVDNMIMSGDVPAGGMVLVYNGQIPQYGFICANGIDWIVYELTSENIKYLVDNVFGGNEH